LVFYLCSRVGPLLYNPARHPAFIKAPRLLGSMPSYCFVLVVATTDPHSSLCFPPLPSPCHRLDTSSAGGVRCLVHVASFWGMPAEAEAPSRAQFLAVRLFPSRVRDTRSSFSLRADTWRLLCLSCYPQLVEPIRRSYWVFCPM
jgi:hypothetical protein